MRENKHLIRCNLLKYAGLALSTLLFALPSGAQMYYSDDYQREQYYRDLYQNRADYEQPAPPPAAQRGRRGAAVQPYARQFPSGGGQQYDQQAAQMILQEQMNRAAQYQQAPPPPVQPQQSMYDDYYGHRISDEGQVRRVMGEAKYIGTLIGDRNGKPCVVIDKRNFQFYLYDRGGRLLRIGPVAIGKGKTEVGAFETPIGVFPIKSKKAVDDWVRPDWYFIEEGEPIPKKWEDRRVPGFFRYKLVFDGTRYIHYAEATGGRLTHGCLGLDWQDAEAVFHTLDVGSYCIIVDGAFLNRLAKGDFPITRPPSVVKPVKQDTPPQSTVTAQATTPEPVSANPAPAPPPVAQRAGGQDRAFQDLW